MEATAILEIKDLCHLYHDENGEEKQALNHINLTIFRGEFVAVIGCNGSGKSTLAKHFNALLTPSSGQCLVDGLDTLDVKQIWQIRQKVGMVFQNPDNQIVASVVEEDVAFGPENLGLPPTDIVRRVAEALRLVNMEEYRLHGPHLLSGGQKQRVAIAGVLAMRPACLVLDEPTAMLDPVGRQEVMDAVYRLNREEKITVVHITHFMEEAVAADRIVVMSDGAIVMTGTPSEVFGETAQLRAVGMDVPVAADIADRLRGRGMELKAGIITDEALADALCP